ncbi:MAG: PopZ family protein [Rhizobiaceae bacterium]
MAEAVSADADRAGETSAEAVAEEVAEEYSTEETTAVPEDEEVQAFREELGDDGEVEAADEAETTSEAVESENPMSALSLADIQAEVASQSELLAEDIETEEEPEVAPLTREEGIGAEPLASEVEIEAEPFTSEADAVSEPIIHEEEVEVEPVVEDVEPEEGAADEGQPEEDGSDTVSEDAGDENSLSALADAITSEALNDKAEEDLASSQASELPATADEVAAQHSAPIVSEQVGKQVAAAFDELNEAFSQPNPENFDRIAEAMMRPMLQEWLDNNLPVLVERLVREEIDRVARGASR